MSDSEGNVKLGWDPVLRDPVSRYRAFLLVFAVLYTLCFCVVMPAYIDEAYTYNLATESSLVRMLSALKDGADGAFPRMPFSLMAGRSCSARRSSACG